jgi:hypothetical protein
MYTQDYEFDPEGWTEDARNWAVLVAAENFVIMCEDIAGTPPIGDIVKPASSSSLVAKAWHHLLPGYTSGYMYYGTALDMEVKQSLAANIATDYAGQVITANPGVDNTPPSVFIPQRYPYNPGGTGFGPTYGYQQHENSSDFTVWTFAFDVSGLDNVVLKYRVDEDGVNPTDDHANDTYSGGNGVGQWQSIIMESRLFPAGNITNNPDIDFFIMPDHIAYQYWAEVSGLSDTLVDYYVEATDTYGNTFKTPIQHVFVGTESPGGQGDVVWNPETPDNNDVITITVNNATQGGNLHWGVNGFNQPDEAYWPAGTFLVNGTGPAVETPFTGPTGDNQLILQIGPFDDPAQDVYYVSFVIHYDDDTWDNNNGQDYVINIGPGGTDIIQWIPSEPTTGEIITITVNQAETSGKLHWGVNGWNQPDETYWPEGSFLFGGTGPAIQSPMDGPNAQDQLTMQIGPFNNPVQEVTEINFVISFDDGTWNNNNGLDYHIQIVPAPAAGSARGAVTNSENDLFLSGASVVLSDGILSFSAETSGEITPGINYLIENIPPGTYEATCSKNGFETQTQPGVNIVADEFTTLNFQMVPIDYPLPPGWDFDMTPVSHNISIPEGLSPQFNGDPLNYGDYIGLFYNNAEGSISCGGAIQFNWEETVIAAFGDDNFTPEKDGFNTGDELQWRIYSQVNQADYAATAAYNTAFPQSDGLFYPNGLSQITMLESTSHTTQELLIPAGWSGISTFVNPTENNIENIFAPFINNFVIMSSATAIYYPEAGTNTIQNWDYHTGYKIKTLTDLTLELTGAPLANLTVNLDSGWNLIPVMTSCGATPAGIADQLNGLNLIKGIATTEVYWPEYNIQSLSHLDAGKAYWLSVSQDNSFTYPECSPSDDAAIPHKNQSFDTPWNDVLLTGASHLMVLPAVVMMSAELRSGDIIGLITGDGLCAGTRLIENINQNTVLIAFANDETTIGKDGFDEGDAVSFRMYRPELNKEAILDVIFDEEKPQQEYFSKNGISVIKSLEINSTGLQNNFPYYLEIYPNPTSGIFSINTGNYTNDLNISITDAHGKMIKETHIKNVSGKSTFDLSGHSEGLYFVKITAKDFTFARKILLIKSF